MREKTLLCPSCGCDVIGLRDVPLHGGAYLMFAAICPECHMSGPVVPSEEAAIKSWNALPRALRWTKEPPKNPGFYWIRFDKEEVRMLEFRQHELKTIQKITEWEWAGPIPEPKEK